MALALTLSVQSCKKGQVEEPPAPMEDTVPEAEAPRVNEDSLRAEVERQARMEEAAKAIEQQLTHVYEQVHEAYCNSPVGESIDLDGLYCTDDWLQTIDAVRVKDTARQDQPFTDTDYWVMDREVEGAITVTDIVIDSLDLDEGTARASLLLHNGKKEQPLWLDLLLVEDTWRIDGFTQLLPDTFVWKVSMRDYLEGKGKYQEPSQQNVKARHRHRGRGAGRKRK